MKKTILVIGATGKQGGAVIRALLEKDFSVRAFTRDPGSDQAITLSNNGTEVVQGNLDDFNSLMSAKEHVYGVFSVQPLKGGVRMEIEHGKRVADAALQSGVKHFVYSSVGGAERNSRIAHFESKWEIEKYIRSLRLPYTTSLPFLSSTISRGFPD